MKKTAIALAMATVLGVAGTAMAANPFTDVPANHWSYASVSKLAQAGIIEGYGDGTFRGNNSITRYEMAQMVAKAMARSDKADAAQKAMIEKLAAEYSAELNNLGVRVTAVEKKVGSVKVDGGDARIRYMKNYQLNDTSSTAGSDRLQERLRIKFTSQLSNSVSMTARITAQNLIDNETPGVNDQLEYDQAYFKLKNAMDKVDLTVGRQYLWLGQGLLSDANYYDAVRADYAPSKDFKVFAIYGDNRYAAGPVTNNVLNSSNTNNKAVAILSTEFNVAKNWPMSVTYFNTSSLHKEVVGASIAHTFGDFKLSYDYATNIDDTYSDGEDAHFATLWYKGAQKAKAGSWGAYVDYRNVGNHSIDGAVTTLNAAYDAAGYGVKGFGYGFNYAFAKNAIFTFQYEDLEAQNGVGHDALYNVRTEFYF